MRRCMKWSEIYMANAVIFGPDQPKGPACSTCIGRVMHREGVHSIKWCAQRAVHEHCIDA